MHAYMHAYMRCMHAKENTVTNWITTLLRSQEGLPAPAAMPAIMDAAPETPAIMDSAATSRSAPLDDEASLTYT